MSQPNPTNEELRRKFAHLFTTNEWDLDEGMRLVKAYTAEQVRLAQSKRLLDWIEEQDAAEVMHLLGIIAFKYAMQKTNASDFKTTLHEFNYKGEVLGDLTVSAALTPQSDTKGTDNAKAE